MKMKKLKFTIEFHSKDFDTQIDELLVSFGISIRQIFAGRCLCCAGVGLGTMPMLLDLTADLLVPVALFAVSDFLDDQLEGGADKALKDS